MDSRDIAAGVGLLMLKAMAFVAVACIAFGLGLILGRVSALVALGVASMGRI